MTLLMLAFACGCRAQENVKGKVTGNGGEPLPSAVVKLYGGQEGKMLAYCLTDRNGRFDIGTKEGWLPARLTVTYLGYRQKSITVDDVGKTYHVKMEEEAVALKEVTVKSVPISSRGDTIIYNVASFRSASDRNIEDVIKKLPGISVAQNGVISYQGESINKFYIEGLDLLSGRYALATKNISPDDIATISIYENHQPKKILKGLELSDKAALNLTLKDKSMLKPVGTLTAGAGYGEGTLWTGELYGMLIGKTQQHLVTAKGNNTGRTYADETVVLTPEGDASTDTKAWKVFPDDPFGTTGIPEERYAGNKSASAAANTLLKAGKETTVTINADYSYDRNSYGNRKTVQYGDGQGGYITVDEDNSSLTQQQKADLHMKVENNSDKLYLLEKLSMRGRFVRDAYVLGDGNTATQRQRTNDFCISNIMNLGVKDNDKVWQVNSEISFSDTPLNGISAVIPGQEQQLIMQDVTGINLHTRENTSLQWLMGLYSDLTLKIEFEADYDRITAARNPDDGPGRSDDRGYKLSTTVTPRYQYKRNSVFLRVEMPVMMYNISYKNIVSQSRYTLNRPYVGMQGALNVTMPHMIKMIMRAGSNVTTGDITDFITAPIYTTYRTVTTLGTGTLSVKKNLYASLGFNYRNTLNGTFATATGGYRVTKANTTSGSDVSESETTSTSLDRKSKTRLWTADVYAAKNFYGADMTLAFTGNFVSSRRDIVRQGLAYDVTNTLYMAAVDAAKDLFDDALSVSVNCTYTHSVLKTGMTTGQDVMNEIETSARVSVFPVKNLEIYANASHDAYWQNENGHRDNLYVDGGMKWSVGKSDIELAVRNITNKDCYTKRNFTANDIYTYTYSLRPREFTVSVKYNF